MTNRKGDQIDLKDENVIDQNETWRFQVSAVMGLRNPTICLLLNLQNIDFPNYYILHVNITTMNSSSVGYFVEATKKHEENYETTPDEYDNVMIPIHKNSVFDLSQEITTRKNTKKYKCDKSNSHKKSNCIKKDIAKYIQCKPPWYSEDESEVTNVCIGLTKLEEYQNVTFELSANKTFRHHQTDCYQDNCKQSLWKMKNTAQLPTNADNVTMATFKVQNYVSVPNSPNNLVLILSFQDVHIREEIFNYDELDLIADFGGIMGLLLGASILSVCDFLEVIMRRFFDFIKDKTCPT